MAQQIAEANAKLEAQEQEREKDQHEIKELTRKVEEMQREMERVLRQQKEPEKIEDALLSLDQGTAQQVLYRSWTKLSYLAFQSMQEQNAAGGAGASAFMQQPTMLPFFPMQGVQFNNPASNLAGLSAGSNHSQSSRGIED